MRDKRILMVLVMAMLTLSGCSSQQQAQQGTVVSSVSSDDYQTLLPHEISEGRYWSGNTSSRVDMLQMPKQLLELSKKHFSVKENYMQAGQVLTYEDIQELQRYESEDHPYGMNPSSTFEISDAISVERPYIVYGIF